MGGGGKGGKAAGEQAGRAFEAAVGHMGTLADMSQDLWGITKPVQEMAATQALDTVRAGPMGATGAIAPLISRSVEASKMAQSGALRGSEENLARTGLTGTPFGQQQLGQMSMQGELQQSQLPSQMASDHYYKQLGIFLPGAMGQAPVAMSGIGQAAGTAGGMYGAGTAAASNAYGSELGFLGGLLKPGK